MARLTWIDDTHLLVTPWHTPMASQDPLENPESILTGPEPESKPDLPHWLVVSEWQDWDCSELAGDLFEIEHHPDCPTELRGTDVGLRNGYLAHDCVFQQMVDDMGIDAYFQHRDDPAKDDPYTERVAPGRWPIEPWFHTYHGHEGNEYDAGLRLAEGEK